jgi:hypothetical protein
VSLPLPRVGLVIRYAFLWSHEAARGSDEARTDRPGAVVVAARQQGGEEVRVVVAPVTHAPTPDSASAIELPSDVKRLLGLDAARQWLRFEELNPFTWPGFDMRPVPGRAGQWDYGMLPRSLFEQLRHGVLRRQREETTRVQDRD